MSFSKTLPIPSDLCFGLSRCSSLSVLFHLVFVPSLEMTDPCSWMDHFFTNGAFDLLAFGGFVPGTFTRFHVSIFVCDIFVTTITMPTLVQVTLYFVPDPFVASRALVFPSCNCLPFFFISSCLRLFFGLLLIGLLFRLIFRVLVSFCLKLCESD